MDTNKILYYTDGHEVMITDSGFRVKKTTYNLNGITRHGLSIIYPARAPFAVLIIIGSLLFACGAINFLPASISGSVTLLGFTLLTNSVVMAAGIFLLIIGLLIMFMSKEKYAVRIFTAEGEKNVVISRSREYISQIVDALNRAFLDLVKQSQKGPVKSQEPRLKQ
ncbi:hypothetical protein WSM22_22650 [Cytophagales bacterium WSM2-2]|nr:hypothetical protein WSM22_22650 [Cytophagales bacterium WSM2-2]